MIGIVVPLALEGRCLGPWFSPSSRKLVQHGEILARVSGIGARRAELAARELVAQGASALISFGTAAALDPSLEPGALLLPGSILSAAGASLAVDVAWRDRLADCFGDSARVCGSPLVQADGVLATVEDKQRMAAETGACAADMESAAIGEVARDHERPFVCVRSVADDARLPLPKLVLVAVDERGRARPGAALRALVRRPQDLGRTIQVWRGFRKAQRTLKQIARRAGPRFQAPPAPDGTPSIPRGAPAR